MKTFFFFFLNKFILFYSINISQIKMFLIIIIIIVVLFAFVITILFNSIL